SFVGSSRVAGYIYKTARAPGKRGPALRAAQKHPVVMPGADLGAPRNALMGGGFCSASEGRLGPAVGGGGG
ncbi:hypothetical protein Q8F86_26835, partial [Klebsiella pneumoniae]|nr:hypothetical protein [Klebsiella pneumoniae]